MKRKHGNKKGKLKKARFAGEKKAISNAFTANTEDKSLDDMENNEYESDTEDRAPSSMNNDHSEKIVSVNVGKPVDKTTGHIVYGRVRVKIKTSKTLDSQVTSSDAHTQSDTDKSSQQMGLEKQVVNDKMENSDNSLAESTVAPPVNAFKNTSNIKIKSSKAFNSSSISPCSNVARPQSERADQKEFQLPHRESKYNKQELNAALEVIRKIMKMEAAEPFNAPVNPIALGIPDYFDVIDTPMDFGTLCSNLENGIKYTNSGDVYKDVQYIWDNCYKYNNKGDYILDLMKRVKKNFTKYWTAAGLYSEPSHGVESIQAKDSASSHGPVKAHLKLKTRKRHGVKKHKEDCLCAICVMIRRRQEREESVVDDLNETSDDHLVHEVKPQARLPVESPCGGEGTSSNADNSPESDADGSFDEKEEKLEPSKQLYSPVQENPMEMENVQNQEEEMENDTRFQNKGEGENSEHLQLGDRVAEEQNREDEAPIMECSGDTQNDHRKEESSLQHDDEMVTVKHQTPKELQQKFQKAEIYKDLQHLNNPMVLGLCGSLFATNDKSFWSGPHSLVQCQGLKRSSAIHDAVTSFMN